MKAKDAAKAAILPAAFTSAVLALILWGGWKDTGYRPALWAALLSPLVVYPVPFLYLLKSKKTATLDGRTEELEGMSMGLIGFIYCIICSFAFFVFLILQQVLFANVFFLFILLIHPFYRGGFSPEPDIVDLSSSMLLVLHQYGAIAFALLVVCMMWVHLPLLRGERISLTLVFVGALAVNLLCWFIIAPLYWVNLFFIHEENSGWTEYTYEKYIPLEVPKRLIYDGMSWEDWQQLQRIRKEEWQQKRRLPLRRLPLSSPPSHFPMPSGESETNQKVRPFGGIGFKTL